MTGKRHTITTVEISFMYNGKEYICQPAPSDGIWLYAGSTAEKITNNICEEEKDV